VVYGNACSFQCGFRLPAPVFRFPLPSLKNPAKGGGRVVGGVAWLDCCAVSVVAEGGDFVGRCAGRGREENPP
jgi:hypothetical protein